MSRADVNIVSHLGVEVTPGDPVDANRRLPDIEVEVMPEHEKKFYRGAGYKANTIGVMNKNSGSGKFNGPLNYSSLVYILASYSNYATPSAVGTGGFGWTFAPGIGGTADVIKTYTIQQGDSTDAEQVTNAIFNSLDIEITRDDGKVSGEVLAKNFSVGNALNPSPTTIPNTPVSMNDMSLFLDTTSAGLGVTKLERVFRLSIKLPKKVEPEWFIDADQSSWGDTVEIYQTPKLTLEAEFSPQMQALYTALKADNVDNYFLRALAEGNNIGAGADYTYQGDFALQFTDAKPQRNSGKKVYAYTFEFEIMADPVWGKMWEMYLVNALSDL